MPSLTVGLLPRKSRNQIFRLGVYFLPVHSTVASADIVMQPQQNFGAPGPDDRLCTQCGSPMPKEMRFCRSCGNRLGEGPAEYTETVRLPGATASGAPGTTPFCPSVNAPLMQQPAYKRRRRLGFTGNAWIWIVLVAFFAVG